jgi:hypothetical protein
MVWLVGFAILEAPVELAISVHLDWSTDHRETPVSVPHLAKCDVNPVFLRHYASVADVASKTSIHSSLFHAPVSWADKLIYHNH